LSDAAMSVQWLNGGRIGSVEENFIAGLREGDCFIFSGRVLQLVRVRDLTAFVTKAPGNQGAVPVWQGGKMPLSSELADTALDLLGEADALLRQGPGGDVIVRVGYISGRGIATAVQLNNAGPLACASTGIGT
jgi:ATP-dependent Lhr-like helicase